QLTPVKGVDHVAEGLAQGGHAVLHIAVFIRDGTVPEQDQSSADHIGTVLPPPRWVAVLQIALHSDTTRHTPPRLPEFGHGMTQVDVALIQDALSDVRTQPAVHE